MSVESASPSRSSDSEYDSSESEESEPESASASNPSASDGEQPASFALNESLVSEVTAKSGSDAREVGSELSDKASSAQWNDDEESDDSDDWLSYQKQFDVQVPLGASKTVSENQYLDLRSARTFDNAVVVENDSSTLVQKVENNILEKVKRDDATERVIQGVPIFRSEVFLKTDVDSFTQSSDTETLHVNPNIKPIVPKKPKLPPKVAPKPPLADIRLTALGSTVNTNVSCLSNQNNNIVEPEHKIENKITKHQSSQYVETNVVTSLELTNEQLETTKKENTKIKVDSYSELPIQIQATAKEEIIIELKPESKPINNNELFCSSIEIPITKKITDEKNSTEFQNENDPSFLLKNTTEPEKEPFQKIIVTQNSTENELKSEDECPKSPLLNRKFNSVSPKRKDPNGTSPKRKEDHKSNINENKALAISLDGQLDKHDTIVCHQKDDDDEGISSDTDSKISLPVKGIARVSVRRDNKLKRDSRPKSEAFLNTLVQSDKLEELYKSNVSLNSVEGSVQSSNSVDLKTSRRQNSVDSEEAADELKDLEKKRPNFAFIRGSDPRVATCRGKLQNKRSKLNQEINKELRLRAGAENLFKATTNRKLKETVALELSFVNSNLQLLKEQLAELNSSVELYQGDSPEPVMPMIPLGLKETKEIDFREPFKDFILEHYSEDGANYEDSIAELMDMRQAMRTPHRDGSGVALLFQYYNQLYFVERRFFPPDRSLGIYFEWYDSLTGVPSCQRTVAFEKACVLFNIAALYTQLGAKQDRLTAKGLDQAVDNFLRAAGTFTYVHENFTNAPSMDLAPHMLDMLVQLMLAQARECLFEKLELQSRDKRDVDVSLDLAQEAAQVSEIYCTVQTLISVSAVRDYVPYSWLSLVQVKREHYAALARYHSAAGLLARDLDSLSARTKQSLRLLHRDTDPRTQLDIAEPHDDHERKLLGRAHLRAALMLHEEAERLLRMCRELRNKQALTQVLCRSREATLTMYNSHVEKIDDFSDILDPPHIHASTKFQLSLTPPDFAQLRVEDLFKGLGPVAIFSAKHHWTAPRTVQLHRGDGEVGFGFSVRGDSPVIIAGVDQGSLAHFGGMKEGDFIVSIGDKDVKWAVHEEVVRLIKDAGDSLCLKLVTPMDRNYLKQPKSSNCSQSSTQSSKSSGSSQPSPSNTASSHKKLTWNPFRRQRERETSFNLILR